MNPCRTDGGSVAEISATVTGNSSGGKFCHDKVLNTLIDDTAHVTMALPHNSYTATCYFEIYNDPTTHDALTIPVVLFSESSPDTVFVAHLSVKTGFTLNLRQGRPHWMNCHGISDFIVSSR